MALKLPITVMNRVDVHRMLREMEALDNFVRQGRIRGGQVNLPRLTTTLETLAAENQIDLLDDEQRDFATVEIKKLAHEAPTTHISFSLEPPAAMVQKITEWFRHEIHPAMMVQVGIQPTIGAGCVIRTQNKFFDFSLRQHLQRNHSQLMKAIHEHGEIEDAAMVQAAVTAPVAPVAATAPGAPAS